MQKKKSFQHSSIPCDLLSICSRYYHVWMKTKQNKNCSNSSDFRWRFSNQFNYMPISMIKLFEYEMELAYSNCTAINKSHSTERSIHSIGWLCAFNALRKPRKSSNFNLFLSMWVFFSAILLFQFISLSPFHTLHTHANDLKTKHQRKSRPTKKKNITEFNLKTNEDNNNSSKKRARTKWQQLVWIQCSL